MLTAPALKSVKAVCGTNRVPLVAADGFCFTQQSVGFPTAEITKPKVLGGGTEHDQLV
jgi:hypothetical protein